jgi:hypothetical protein
MVCGEDVTGIFILIKLFNEMFSPVNNAIDNLDALHIFLYIRDSRCVTGDDCTKYLSMRSVRVTRGVETEEMEENDSARGTQLGVQGGIRSSVLKEAL